MTAAISHVGPARRSHLEGLRRRAPGAATGIPRTSKEHAETYSFERSRLREGRGRCRPRGCVSRAAGTRSFFESDCTRPSIFAPEVRDHPFAGEAPCPLQLLIEPMARIRLEDR